MRVRGRQCDYAYHHDEDDNDISAEYDDALTNYGIDLQQEYANVITNAEHERERAIEYDREIRQRDEARRAAQQLAAATSTQEGFDALFPELKPSPAAAVVASVAPTTTSAATKKGRKGKAPVPASGHISTIATLLQSTTLVDSNDPSTASSSVTAPSTTSGSDGKEANDKMSNRLKVQSLQSMFPTLSNVTLSLSLLLCQTV
jgi:hypothetical protein